MGLNWALHCYLNSVVGEGSVEKGLQLATSELKVYNCFLILKLLDTLQAKTFYEKNSNMPKSSRKI